MKKKKKFTAKTPGGEKDYYFHEMDLHSAGITETMFSRTDEVARCIQLMQQSCIENNLASEVTIPQFMNHSFEEVIIFFLLHHRN